MVMEKREHLRKQINALQEQISEIDEKEWREKEEPLFEAAVGKCWGENTLSSKKKDKSDKYLLYTKLIAYLGDREFLACEVYIHKNSDGVVTNRGISKKIDFFYHAEQVGKYDPAITEEEFQRAYREVRAEIAL